MVVSTERLDANRANAQLSTGPRTEAGKSVSSRNAATHHAYAAHPVAASDGPLIYEDFRREQIAGLSPRTAPERVLADRAASLMWRLQRLQEAQHALPLTADDLAAAYADDNDNAFDRLSKAEQRLTGMLNTTLRNLTQLQSRRAMPADADAAPAGKLQNEPNSDPSAAPSASSAPRQYIRSSPPSVFSPPPGKLRNEPKPRVAKLVFEAATRAAGDLLPPMKRPT